MKVCHMTSTHRPKDQRIFYKECISLAKTGYDVFLVEQGPSEKIDGVTIVGTGEINNSRYYRLLVRPKKIYELALKVNADIYHFHDMELIPYGLKLKKKGKKVIFDYHEDYAMRFSESDALVGPNFLKKILGKLYIQYEKDSIKRFDAMISVTPHICDRLRKINYNTVMITNYPLLQKNSKWGQETVYEKSSNYIAFAGQISDTYRLSFIVECIQNIPNVFLKLCGPERKKGDLEKLRAVDHNNKMEYKGILDYNQIPDFISNSRCAVVLSTYGSNTGGHIGTLGNNKLFEAMLCGVPVICTDYDLWKAIVKQYDCGICVNSYSEKEIIDAVNQIFSHPDMAEKMGKNGRKAVLEEFNWNTQENELLRLYKTVSDSVNK